MRGSTHKLLLPVHYHNYTLSGGTVCVAWDMVYTTRFCSKLWTDINNGKTYATVYILIQHWRYTAKIINA